MKTITITIGDMDLTTEVEDHITEEEALKSLGKAIEDGTLTVTKDKAEGGRHLVEKAREIEASELEIMAWEAVAKGATNWCKGWGVKATKEEVMAAVTVLFKITVKKGK